uniref:Uncharacterized protein n=1 Tax=Rhizophora mucronata TaxID=61149 RepID=A0A2P2PG86_RHIMU
MLYFFFFYCFFLQILENSLCFSNWC